MGTNGDNAPLCFHPYVCTCKVNDGSTIAQTSMPSACSICFTCACMILKVHRSGGGIGEETVEISGSESARQTAQDLIEDIINSQETRG